MDEIKTERALELWKEWFERDCVSPYSSSPCCTFCSEMFSTECFGALHREPGELLPDCIFFRAWQLIKTLED